jgi:hypothetical protein
MRAQLGLRLLVGKEVAGEDVAGAAPVAQADVPDPAGGERGRRRVGAHVLLRLLVVGHPHRDRAVAQQPVLVALERHAERLADQDAREAGAVDEEVGLDALAALGLHGGDVAALGLLDLRDVVDHVMDAAGDGQVAQRLGELLCIHVIGVGDVALIIAVVGPLRRQPLLAQLDLRRHRLGIGDRAVARQPAQPVPVEARRGQPIERMVIMVPLMQPVIEADRLLEGGVGRLHEGALGDLDALQRALDGGDRRLADANAADLLGFDQPDQHALRRADPVQHRIEIGRRDPAGRSAPYHENPHLLRRSPENPPRFDPQGIESATGATSVATAQGPPAVRAVSRSGPR